MFKEINNHIKSTIKAQTRTTSDQDGKQVYRGAAIIDVIDMITDVSSMAREKSSFTLYTNHCYSMHRNSTRLMIELTPDGDL